MGLAAPEGNAMMRLALLLMTTLAVGATPPTGQNQVVLVVVGAPGAEEYATQFAQWAGAWERACSKSDATFLEIGLDETGSSSDRVHLEKILGPSTAGRPSSTFEALTSQRMTLPAGSSPCKVLSR